MRRIREDSYNLLFGGLVIRLGFLELAAELVEGLDVLGLGGKELGLKLS